MTLADGLRNHFLSLVVTNVLGIAAFAAIVYSSGWSRLWLIAGALAIGAVEIIAVALGVSAPVSESQRADAGA